jgi:hypothetical protein
LDQLILKFRQLEWLIIALTLILVLVPAHTTTVSYLAKLDGGCSEAQLSSTPKKPPVPPPGSTKARQKITEPYGSPAPRCKHYQPPLESLQKTPRLAQTPTVAAVVN